MSDLTVIEREYLEKLFQMSGGYVLNFSDRTMNEFFDIELAINIYDEAYRSASCSKANFMRGFWNVEENSLVGKSIKALIKYILFQIDIENLNPKDFPEKIINECQNIAERLLGSSYSEITVQNEKNIFIVHGHDKLALVETSNFLRKIGLTPIILSEQTSSGQTIIEKFEKYSNTKFGIILYTHCDFGNSKNNSESLLPRARQNVIFEHGFLCGKLGRSNVCALVKEDVEKPSDISGIVYIPMDSQNKWELNVSKELKQAGFEIEFDKL